MTFEPSIGLDEVGRGAWAGPFVACAVLVREGERQIRGVRDSKLLSSTQREKIAPQLKESHAFGLGIVTVEELDAIGMTKAQILVFERAIQELQTPLHLPFKSRGENERSLRSRTPPLFLKGRLGGVWTDGLSIKSHPEWTATIKGDQKLYSIAAASIIAKVARDHMMCDLHTQDPRYGFDQHKGYGTALHQRLLKEHGPSVHHRRLFEPIRKMYTEEAISFKK